MGAGLLPKSIKRFCNIIISRQSGSMIPFDLSISSVNPRPLLIVFTITPLRLVRIRIRGVIVGSSRRPNSPRSHPSWIVFTMVNRCPRPDTNIGKISIPPTPTRNALRCRGLRLNRCPVGHPLSRTHPDSGASPSRTHSNSADTRYPVSIRIRVPRRPVRIRTLRTSAVPYPSDSGVRLGDHLLSRIG